MLQRQQLFPRVWWFKYFKLHRNLPDFHRLLISVLCCSSQSLPTSGVQGQLGGNTQGCEPNRTFKEIKYWEVLIMGNEERQDGN